MFRFSREIALGCLTTAAIALLSPSSARADVVYQGPPAGNFAVLFVSNNSLTMGDDVTLGGTARFLTDLTIGTEYVFDSTHTAFTPNLQLTLYQNSGGFPGAVIATSVGVGVTEIGLTGLGQEDVTFSLPLVQVPDSFIYVVQSLNAPDTNFGIRESAAPTVGSTGPGVIVSSDGTHYISTGTGSGDGWDTTIEAAAVPEPSAWMLLGVGGIVALPLRRRIAAR